MCQTIITFAVISIVVAVAISAPDIFKACLNAFYRERQRKLRLDIEMRSKERLSFNDLI